MMHYNRSSTNILLKTKLNNAHCVRDKRYTLITRHRRTSHYKGKLCIWFICIQTIFHHARQGRYKYCIFMVVFPWVRNVIDFLMMFQFLCWSKSEQCLLSLADIYVAVGDPIINCYAFPKPWLKFPTSYFVVCFSSRVDVAGVFLLCWYW